MGTSIDAIAIITTKTKTMTMTNVTMDKWNTLTWTAAWVLQEERAKKIYEHRVLLFVDDKSL